MQHLQRGMMVVEEVVAGMTAMGVEEMDTKTTLTDEITTTIVSVVGEEG